MSLFNTQKKKVGNATAGETKLPAKAPAKTKAIALPKAEKVAEAKAKSQNEKRVEAAQGGVTFARGSAIIKPRITEKATLLAEKHVYTFDVRTDANARQIAEAVALAYKVTPIKVSVASVKAKTMFARGKKGKTAAGKKAYVYLKKGDTIEFV